MQLYRFVFSSILLILIVASCFQFTINSDNIVSKYYFFIFKLIIGRISTFSMFFLKNEFLQNEK